MGPSEAVKKASQHAKEEGKSYIAYYDEAEDTYNFCLEENLWNEECNISPENVIYTTEEENED